MFKIQRLNHCLKSMARLTDYDVRRMHLVYERQINMPVPLKRYNVRMEDGSVHKYTLGDDFVSLKKMTKVGNKYVESFTKFVGSLYKSK